MCVKLPDLSKKYRIPTYLVRRFASAILIVRYYHMNEIGVQIVYLRLLNDTHYTKYGQNVSEKHKTDLQKKKIWRKRSERLSVVFVTTIAIATNEIRRNKHM